MKTDEYWVCQDCYMVHHYGLDTEVSVDWQRDQYLTSIASIAEIHDTCNPETQEGFREYDKAPCDLCSNELHGYRFCMAVLTGS